MHPELLLPSLPARSRLLNLQPCGIGTARAESLTGYVTRLAGAHGVRAGALLQQEIAPRLGASIGAEKGKKVSLSPTYLRSMNGVDSVAVEWVKTLETLTCHHDLRSLTLLIWSGVFSSRGLFRENRAWCPLCYQEDAVVHEHLLWCLKPVTVCPHHRRPLETVCPLCGKKLPVISWRSVPGFCSSCQGWLGRVPKRNGADGLTAAVNTTDWSYWVADGLDQLLAVAPTVKYPPGRNRFTWAFATLTGSSDTSALARKLGVDYLAAWNWSTGRMRPLITQLLLACAKFGTSISAFLTEDALTAGPACNIPFPASMLLKAEPVRRGSRRRQLFSLSWVGKYLQRVLEEDAELPPSLEEISRKMSRNKSYLYRHYPDLCRAITARWKTWNQEQGANRRERLAGEVQEAAIRLYGDGINPSTLEVAKLLTQPGAIRDPAARASLREIRQKLGLE